MKKLLCVFALLLATCLSVCLIGCGGETVVAGDPPAPPVVGEDNSPDAPNPSKPTAPEAKQPTSVTVGDVRVQLLSPTLCRIENKGPKGFEDRASYIVPARTGWDEVSYERSQNDGYTLIATQNYTVFVPDEGGAEKCKIEDGEGNLLWSYTGRTDTNVYLPSPSDELKSWYFTDTPRVIPSEYGYSVNEQAGPLQDWDFDNDAIDAFVFLPKGDYKTFTADYTALTGESEMISLQMLGFWDSRWYAYSADTALQQIKDYTDRGYSIDVLVIDTDWRDASSGVGYQINEQLFPDMAAFLEECHKLNVNVIFNDHPEPKGSNGLDSSEIEYRTENLTLLLSLGLDYWWYDRNWSVALNSFNPDVSVYAFGMYAYNWITSEYLASITDLNEYAERALIMANVDGCMHGKWTYASDISAHRYSIQWTGDIGSRTEALAQEIYAAVFGGVEVGLPYMSSDIGGHTQPVTDSMYTRWFQYGALSTILRVHCTHKDYIGQEGRMPWMFGETAEEVAHTYMDMRYRLLPLYYSLSRQNFEGGLPVMRRLDINYSQYVESQRNDEYLLGDYVLVAPIDEGKPFTPVPAEYLKHTSGSADVAGLSAKYYNNKDFSGSPVRTQVDSQINFEWGNGGPAGVGTDNFSIEWTGKITFGPKKARLTFFADDTVIAYIDGKKVVDGSGVYDNYLSTEYYEPNSTHELRVTYVEEGGGAHVFMYYEEEDAGAQVTNTRTVFIPEGTWIDVWSGKKYVGPNTVTVAHTIKTSPIFVREGALIALAPNMVNTSAKDWSELSLDVYPSVNFDSNIMLYEDDTKTVAYKSGMYRKTDVSMTFDKDKKAAIITIGKANGQFGGALDFEQRKWNIRVHSYADWGGVEMVKVNGKLVQVSEIAKSKDAKPFAYSGAALDNDIVEFTLAGSVRESYTVEVYFTDPKESAVNADYDDTAVDFDLSVTAAGSAVDFDALGTYGWTSYGEGTEANIPAIKADTDMLIKYAGSYDSATKAGNNMFTKSFTDGALKSSTAAIASQKDFNIELVTTGQKAYYVLYVGGNQCSAKITVRDRAGHVRTEMFGNIDGIFTKRIVIEVQAGEQSTLYVTYSMHASETNGTASPSQLLFYGGFVGDQVPPIATLPTSITAEVTGSVKPDNNINLSDAGADLGLATLDWMHFKDNGNSPERRLKGKGIINVSFNNGQGFNDYPSVIAYSDGDKTGAHTGTRNGTCASGGISMTIEVTPNVKYVRLYTGAWKSGNRVEVYNVNADRIACSEVFTAGDSSVPRMITIRVNATTAERITISIVPVNVSGGNVSLPALAILGEYAQDSAATVTAQAIDASGDVDLTAEGNIDWYYTHTAARKNGGTAIAAPAFGSYTSKYTGYAANFGYTDGTGTAEGSALNGGVACDFVKTVVTIDQTADYIDLYVAAGGGASCGIVVLDQNGNCLLRQTPFTSNSDRVCKKVRLAVSATESAELTVVCYKAGTGAGAFSLAAVAVGAVQE